MDKDQSIPPEKLPDDYRYDFKNPLAQPEDESDKVSPNSALDDLYYNLNDPRRSPWLTVASLEKECPGEIERLDFLTARQKQIIQLRCEGVSFEKIGNHFGITKQAVHFCLGRARERIVKNMGEFRRVMNSSLPGGVDVLINSKGPFFLG